MVLVVVLGAIPPLVPATGQETTTAGLESVPNRQAEYNVTFNSTTIDELVLRDVTVLDARIENVTVGQLTVGNETRADVEIENATFERLVIQQSVVRNVSTGQLSVRNKSVLNVPGGEFINQAGDQSLGRHVIANLTVDGVVIEQLYIPSLTIEAEPEQIEGDLADQPANETDEEPDVFIAQAETGNATVTNASFERGAVENASVDDETVTPGTDEGADDSDGGNEERVSDGGNGDLAGPSRVSERIGR